MNTQPAEKLQEGALYKVVSGELIPLPIDADDQALRKLRITEEVLRAVQEVQKRMRKSLNGRKPDLALVAEALLVYAAQQEGVEEVVRQYAIKVYSGQ